ncbi:hypothetical protein H0A61_01410 [Koleobacter methoxysyntrophicus]|uniref:DUF1116 domain-containing protein n=1 Tax=Koleobacter methoxysyntrophicus TaxID=2751313 RepID=A0A8A0RLC9_9FIRM|nr:DUF1116 domain-containing protein [Koleobacter methoxysyntrophicus]QSQ09053.1 hypothetical protein H0A61_01410 [Koleobacter methoxysyntrophicus]
MDINAANQKAVEKVLNAQPVLVDIGIAGEVIPGMTKKTILHAGPPITWQKMSGPMRGAVMGALIYEGLAGDIKEAEELAASGEITFDPCHHHNAVGPMAGIVSASMPVFIVQNKAEGNYAYCTLNEGLGKVLRYGAYGPEVIQRLKWMEKVLAPALKEALEIVGEINLKNLIAQAIQMGDECHNRNKAGTSLFMREIAPGLVQTKNSPETIAEIFKFISGNDHFFLNLSMPACKCTMDAAHGIENSTMVTAMARNGTEFGIRVSGLGDRWFTGPASVVDGLYFPGYSSKDANPDIGDSVISETAGIGGFAMAAAPAIVKFVGGTAKDAINYTLSMYEITIAENNAFGIPVLEFRGTPTGIDIRKVVETGILPAINTGIAHKKPGVGQVGAGLVKPPVNCFEDALVAFAEMMENK